MVCYRLVPFGKLLFPEGLPIAETVNTLHIWGTMVTTYDHNGLLKNGINFIKESEILLVSQADDITLSFYKVS